MATIQEFHEDFLQSILADSESRGLLKAQSFFERVCEDLITAGDLTDNYTQADYSKKGLEVSGFDFDEERKILTLLNHQFFQEDDIQTLTKNLIDTKLNRLKTFFEKCLQGLFKSIEETSEAYSMAYSIYRYFEKSQIQKVRLMVLTDGKATRNLAELPTENYGKITFEFRVIDVEYLHKIYESQAGSAVFEVDVDLPCLKINDETNSYQSYLTVINGNLLFKIYEDFGQKLFEQNVRTFLQFKGNVNKGLRNTIEYKPEMFFAYNNGITATATEVEIDAHTGNLSKIKNFQIVNGGQTTSAIYAAKKNSGVDVSSISVQMKLSVVRDIVNQDDFISKVAQYANTQNKISNSDFFSNSPFHKDMKDYSNRIYAPAVGGSQRRTHWFYERVRGEYLNSQAYLKPEAKRKFLLENPKTQVVDKTLLSKTENLWRQRPDVVSKGAQESFKRFAEFITELLEKDNLAITESFFRDAISRVILFKAAERVVTNAEWYDGGFRAQTVAYTIAYLSAAIESTGLFLNFEMIWENQEVHQQLVAMLKLISEQVYEKITHPPTGYANITQWTKNPGCWESVKKIDIDFGELDRWLFVDYEQNKFIAKESKELKAIDSGIDKQIFVINITRATWYKIFDYYRNFKGVKNLNDMKLDLLNKMANSKISLPSEKQSAILYQIYTNAKNEGIGLL
ncbi:MAG TPA: AIPR family protein [Mucilaginibacter sp.]|nr:AIPR family protein [Mucilaginibacter sp.]